MGLSKILVACQCKGDTHHQRLFVRRENSSIEFVEDFFGKENVFYLDTADECKNIEGQITSWEKLPMMFPKDFFQIIYLQYCPIYPPIITYRNPDVQPMRTPDVMEIWEKLFQYGVQCLKQDGAIIIPIDSDMHEMRSKYYAINLPVNRKKIGHFYRKGLVNLLRYMNIDGWQVYLSDSLPASHNKVLRQALPLLFSPGRKEDDQYLLLTRKQTGGKRKTRKLRRK